MSLLLFDGGTEASTHTQMLRLEIRERKIQERDRETKRDKELFHDNYV